MDNDQLTHYRQRLIHLREELRQLQETGKSATATVELDQSSMGRLSRMDALQGQAMAQASARRRQQQLAGIEKALRRLDSGDYGYCEACDEPINPRRLDVDPLATHCLDCAR